MSTIVYATLEAKRKNSPRNKSTGEAAPGFGTYVDAAAALVPAEVLALHAAILTVTAKTSNKTTTITDAATLRWSFVGLIVLSIALYVVPRLAAGRKDWADVGRALIPPAAFVAWTMLQRATAFDAAFPKLSEGPRVAIALGTVVVLTMAAKVLADHADGQPSAAEEEAAKEKKERDEADAAARATATAAVQPFGG
jgi:hypothetical protein